VRRTAPALLAALALAGCGDSADDQEARDLLERGFATDVDSGVLTLDAELELEGIELLGGPVEFELEGTFRSAGWPNAIPELDMEFRTSVAGEAFDGRVIATSENAWVELRGETYAVGEELWERARESLQEGDPGTPDTLAEAGVDPLDWIDGAEIEGDEEVAGTPTTKVSARVDVERMLREGINEFVSEPEERIPERVLDQIEDYVGEPELEIWIGEDDIWRRISSEVVFDVPADERDSAGGPEGGRVELDVELDDPNEPVQIEGPDEARPISGLFRQLGLEPELFLGPGFEAPVPG
jgi:hypothetical protein